MINNIIKKVRNSLFVKLIIVFVAAYAFLMFVSFSSHEFLLKKAGFPTIQRHVVNYSRYLVDDIGTPPDTVKARSVAAENDILIKIEGQEFNWQNTRDGLLGFDELDIPEFEDSKNIRAGFDRGLYVDMRKGDYRFLFRMQRREEGFQFYAEMHLVIIIIVFTLIILVVYLLIRRLLKPIKDLDEAVYEVAKGNFDYEITSNRSDELGQLIYSFNGMSRRVKDMIHSHNQLLLDVSHELRSPLTRMKVALEFIDDEEARLSISEDIGEVETMISELLETERLKSEFGGIRKKEINLVELLSEISTTYNKTKPGVKLVDFPKALSVHGDVERLKILFNNILANAIKYSDPGGYPVEVSHREKQNEITIEFQDFGTGIPENDLPYIFEPFYRVDKSRSKKTGGYGLGMSISKKIITAHGGSIEVTSKEGVGTSVFVKFVK